MNLLLGLLFHELEKHILSLRFNALGAMKFDQDLRSLLAYLVTLTPKGLRNLTGRLSQIASLLNFESVDELNDYLGSRKSVLSLSEMKSVLALRVEFSLKDMDTLF